MLLINGKDGTSLAAYLGHVDVAKVLIQNGADVNAVDLQLQGITTSKC